MTASAHPAAPGRPAGPGLTTTGRRGRAVLAVCVLASGMAFLDTSVVLVALPAVRADLGAGVAGLQWTVNAYTLALAALVLTGGALGDRLGRRRVFTTGVVLFAGFSLACGLAPSTGVLVAARGLQGVGAALLVPGSLALLQASFAPAHRARAIGTWSGLAGVTTAVGPVVGGWLVDVASWRWVFLLNVPVAVVVLVLTRAVVPESRAARSGRPDVAGAVLSVLALGGLTLAVTEAADAAVAVPSLVVAALAVVALVLVERRAAHPMLPAGLFTDRLFRGANVVTFGVYAALGGVLFLLVQFLQSGAGFTPLRAGSALVPLTVLLALLSPRAGALSRRWGPRPLLVAGPTVSALGVAVLARLGPDAAYLSDVLPGVLLLGLGMAATVAPVTAAAMEGAPESDAGLASGVNNAVARAGGLLCVAALPVLVGLGPAQYDDPAAFAEAARTGFAICSGLLLASALAATRLPRRRAGAPCVPSPG